jgi:hypothetical protein
MKTWSAILALLAALTGLCAAYKWYKASKIEIELGYIYPGTKDGETFERNGLTLPRQPQSGDPELNRINEIAATWAAINQASKLNKEAALWTALSVALAGAASIVGALAGG